MIPDNIAAEWSRCRAWLVPALEDVTEPVLLEWLASGRAQLWAGERCAMVTTLLAEDERKIVAWLTGGDLREVVQLVPGISAWARSQGAQAAWVYGRKGWGRVLEKVGFVAVSGGLRKAL